MKKPLSLFILIFSIAMLYACGNAADIAPEPVQHSTQASHEGAGTGAFGVFYEPCAGNVSPYEHLSHYVYWDAAGQVVLLGNTSTTLAPDLAQFNPASPREDAVTFLEWGNDVSCLGESGKCSDTQHVRYLPGGESAAIPLEWRVLPVDSLMDAVPFAIPGTPVRITCSSMRVVGTKCLQVTARLRALGVQLNDDFGGIIVDDAACSG